MPAGSTILTLAVVPQEGCDESALNRLTLDLADRLRSLDIAVERHRVPVDGTNHRSGTEIALGVLAATGVVAKPLMNALVTVVQAWLRRNEADKVVVEIDGERLEITGSKASAPEEILESFYRNRRGGI